MHKGRTLLNLLDKEEKERINANRPFEIPDFRTGDVVKFSTYKSLSEKKEMQYSGVVIGKKQPNNIRAACSINFNVEGTNVVYTQSLYSPLINSFEISKYGSNQLRKKLNHIPALDLSAGRL